MKNDERIEHRKQGEETPKSVLKEIIREGARRLLQAAIENEVAEYVDHFTHVKDAKGHRMVVRNGTAPERDLVTGIGPLKIRRPRIRDTRQGEIFTSAILPRYMRRLPTIDTLIPILLSQGYLNRRHVGGPGVDPRSQCLGSLCYQHRPFQENLGE
jgi:hypothetical protein